MIEPLTPVQQRVLGALAEKAATVPDTYPMTLNGLRAACNQKSSRDPVTDHDDATILATLDELKAAGLARFVYASHGARTTKYRHVLDEVLGLDRAELAVVTVLLLRGPQTVNELRVRTERAHAFEDNDAVDAVLRSLAAREVPLARELPRRSGQKETRWVHLLGPDGRTSDDDGSPAASAGASSTPEVGPSQISVTTASTVQDDHSGLAERVAALEARVAALEALLVEPGPSGDDPQEHPT